MNENERSGLANLRDRWIAGGAAADLAPAEWKQTVSAAPAGDRERLLLAIAGQALDVAFRPAAPKALVRHPPLPRLALPALPDELRPLFRAALRRASDDKTRIRVARLAAARGFVAHPLDWMPSASDLEVPSVYAPWVDWQAQGRGEARGVPDELTVENWDDFYPAARRMALAGLRRADPAKARALLAAKAGGEAAEARFALIEQLGVNLSGADTPYLQSLAGDRSGKVKQLAGRLLARIGERDTDGDDGDAAELAGFIEAGRTGLLRRRTIYTPRDLTSPAQGQRRAELFDTCRLIDLAERFGAAAEDFVAGWQVGKDGADRSFADMVAASGSDASVTKLADALLAVGNLGSLRQLLPRLGQTARRSVIRTVLAAGGDLQPFVDAVDLVDAGAFERDELMGSRLYGDLRAGIAGGGEVDRSVVGLGALGYLATASAADAILSDLAAAGLGSAASPLALMRFNAALGRAKR